LSDEYLCLSAQPVQEGLVGDETILVLLVSQLLEELLSVLLGDLITQVGQEVVELGQHHGSVLVLVVELAQLDVVVVVSGIIGLLDGLLHEGNDLIKFAEFFASIVSLTILDANLLDDIHAKGIEDVHEVVHVQHAFAIPIVDVADPLDFVSVDRHGG
jgi:hypothetical protein